jgi:hypothetical protein
VFTELSPDTALIKSVTIILKRLDEAELPIHRPEVPVVPSITKLVTAGVT